MKSIHHFRKPKEKHVWMFYCRMALMKCTARYVMGTRARALSFACTHYVCMPVYRVDEYTDV